MRVFLKLLPLIAVLFSFSLFAQNKSVPGFYITRNGDTVKGIFPNFRQWNNNPQQVEFLSAANSQPVELTPANCLKFTIENYDEYLSYSGPRMINPIGDILNNSDFSGFENAYDTVTIFLRLIRSPSNFKVYVFSDNIRTNFFYQRPGEPLVELKFKKYFEKERIAEISEYRQQLNNLFSEEIQKKNMYHALELLPYSEDAIAEFLQKLFSDGKSKTRMSLHSEWIIKAGFSANSVKVTGDESMWAVKHDYESAISPMISFGIMLPTGRNFGRYFFYPQISLSNYKNSGQSNDGSFNRVTTFESKLVVTGEINIGLYLVNGTNFRWFIYGGGGFKKMVDNKQTEERIIAADNQVYSSYVLDMMGLTYNIDLSTGIRLTNKFLLSATYNLPAPLSNFSYYTPWLSSIQVGLAYKLN
jgi:hypothetical protein